jgi:hypothetical protein
MRLKFSDSLHSIFRPRPRTNDAIATRRLISTFSGKEYSAVRHGDTLEIYAGDDGPNLPGSAPRKKLICRLDGKHFMAEKSGGGDAAELRIYEIGGDDGQPGVTSIETTKTGDRFAVTATEHLRRQGIARDAEQRAGVARINTRNRDFHGQPRRS